MKIGDLVQWVYEGMPDLAAADIGVVVHVYTEHLTDPAGTSIDVMWEDGEFCLQLAGDVEVVNEGR